ncbi:MAG: hypothetical protein ACKOQ6_10510 [Bacteroidota bacterium]
MDPDCAAVRTKTVDDASATKDAMAKMSVRSTDGCCTAKEVKWGRIPTVPYRFFFLCLFLRRRFLRLCVAILCLFLFLPLGMD